MLPSPELPCRRGQPLCGFAISAAFAAADFISFFFLLLRLSFVFSFSFRRLSSSAASRRRFRFADNAAAGFRRQAPCCRRFSFRQPFRIFAAGRRHSRRIIATFLQPH